MSSSVIFLAIAVILVGIMVFIGISMAQKRKHQFDKQEYQGRWLQITNAVEKDNPATYTRAIMEADKLFDHAMVELGIRGNTMGERLKHCGGNFSHLNAIWAAHKMRNRIAHEIDYKVDYKQTQVALRVFRQGLKELGAI